LEPPETPDPQVTQDLQGTSVRLALQDPLVPLDLMATQVSKVNQEPRVSPGSMEAWASPDHLEHQVRSERLVYQAQLDNQGPMVHQGPPEPRELLVSQERGASRALKDQTVPQGPPVLQASPADQVRQGILGPLEPAAHRVHQDLMVLMELRERQDSQAPVVSPDPVVSQARLAHPVNPAMLVNQGSKGLRVLPVHRVKQGRLVPRVNPGLLDNLVLQVSVDRPE